MSALLEPVLNGETRCPLESFTGAIHRARTSPLYTAGLALVAFGMVLLPLLYLGLIALMAGLMVLHATYDTWILTHTRGSGGATGRALMYFGPLVAGAIMILFMVKPLFAARPKAPEPVTLDPERERLLFAFVGRICELVGAPVPSRINVDCQVNASAALRHGLLSRQLGLTVGLPLVAGLDMRQFAGVLAHEFGHFAQGAGMRLTYIIRHINMWFARVVYERDKWDISLDRAARELDIRIAIVLKVANFCVWLSRRILWGLMHAGNAISCFMLRQMEYDADTYEAKIAGSDAFESTSNRLVVLNVGMQGAQADIEQSWSSKRLPQDLPLLVSHKAATLPADLLRKIKDSRAAKTTGWFDTHPCDADRVRHARALNEPGVFRRAEPASQLFSNFAELSKNVTCDQYRRQLELEFTEENLLSTEQTLQESAANTEADAMIRKFYGKVNFDLLPLLTATEVPPLPPAKTPIENWRVARKESEAQREQAEKASAEMLKLTGRLTKLRTADALVRAGFSFESSEVGLSGGIASIGASIAQLNHVMKLEQQNIERFLIALRARVTLALRLGVMSSSPGSDNIQELVRILAAVGAEMPRMPELGSRLQGFVVLVKSIQNHSEPAKVERVLSGIGSELQSALTGMQGRLSLVPYPFPHPRGALSVAQYGSSEDPTAEELVPFDNANTYLNRLPLLHFRLLGKLLAHVDSWESQQAD